MRGIDNLPILGGALSGTELEVFFDELGVEGTPVTTLGLTARTNSCLRRLEIHALEELLRTPAATLLKVKNFGRVSLRDLQETILQFLTARERGDPAPTATTLSPRESGKLSKALGIKRLYEELGTYEAVGKRLGVSRQRIAQIIEQLETRWGMFIVPPRERARQALLEKFPKELLMELVRRCGTIRKFREKHSLSTKEFHYLLVAHAIDRSELEQDLALRRTLTEYEEMVRELGWHPSTTIMQQSRKWRALYARIEGKWGSINRFRRHYGYPIPKPGNPFFREDMERGLRRRMARLKGERDRKKEDILAFIRRRGGARPRVIRAECQVKPSWLWPLVRELVNEGKVLRAGQGNQIVYIAAG